MLQDSTMSHLSFISNACNVILLEFILDFSSKYDIVNPHGFEISKTKLLEM